MALRLYDDLARELLFVRPPRRIVSLVPSDTYNLFALGAGDRVVGRTRYCVEPAAAERLPTVGGTKDVDVDAVAALEPDLVVANQEENSRQHLEQLARRRLTVLVSFPKRVADGIAHLARLARIVEAGEEARELLRAGYRMLAEPRPARGIRAFVPIWMDPLMTVNADTYISDALALCGVENVFADRERRYPLQADLGTSPGKPAGDRDTRYPRIALEEVVRRDPRIVLLPDEPHAFTEQDAAVLREALPRARIVFCSGRDLCWYGARSIDGVPRLNQLFGSHA